MDAMYWRLDPLQETDLRSERWNNTTARISTLQKAEKPVILEPTELGVLKVYYGVAYSQTQYLPRIEYAEDM